MKRHKIRNKKIMAALLALIMLLTLLPLGALAVEGEAIIESGSATIESTATGEDRKVEIPVNLTQNPGIATYILAVSYDKNALTLDDIVKGADAPDDFLKNVADGIVTAGTNEGSNFYYPCTMFTLKFTVNEGAAPGEYPISISPSKDDPGNICNEDLEDVPITFIDGKVTVAGEPGPELYTIEVNVGPSSATVEFFNCEGYDENDYDIPGEKITAVVDNGVVSNYHQYILTVPQGTISFRAKDADGKSLGGMTFEAPERIETDASGNPISDGYKIYLRQLNFYSMSFINDKYLTENDYRVEITDALGMQATMGEFYKSGNYTYFPLMTYAGGNAELYTFYYIPTGDLEGVYAVTVSTNQAIFVGTGAQNKNANLALLIDVAITAPSDADVQVFWQKANYYAVEVFDGLDKNPPHDNGDGTTTYTYRLPAGNGNYTYRVSQDGMTTRAGYLTLTNADTAKTSVTFSDRDPKDTENVAGNTNMANRIESGLIMNVNDQNHLKLDVDGSFRLRGYRAPWEIINGDTANIRIDPDFSHEILYASDDDVISISEVTGINGNASGNWLDITGNKAGTVILEMTYDAIEVTGGSYGDFNVYGAVDPERSGVVVITVGSRESDIDLNSTWNTDLSTVHFLDSTGVFSFYPEADSGVVKVEVAAAGQGEISSFTEVAGGEDGYDVPINEGSNVIRVTSGDGSVSYQVVRGKQIGLVIRNISDPGSPIRPGDEVYINFTDVNRPVPKLAGIFNPTALFLTYASAVPEEENRYESLVSQYQRMEKGAGIILTIPADFEGDTFTLTDGRIDIRNMFAAADPWDYIRNITDRGYPANFSAVMVNASFYSLPDIEIPLESAGKTDLTFNYTDSDGGEFAGTAAVVLTDTQNNVVAAQSEGVYKAVPNGQYFYAVTADGYKTVRGSIRFGATGEATHTETVAMFTASSSAWDGSEKTEPAQAEGVYRISNGAELAWFADAVNGGNFSINAELTGDIDLSYNAWTPIGNNSKRYAGAFDGAGHEIEGLYIDASSSYQGLFGYINGAEVTNVMVSGSIFATGNTSYFGGVTGYAAGASVIKNCHSSVDMLINGSAANGYAGGIVGYLAGSSKVLYCSNSGNITLNVVSNNNRNYAGIAGVAYDTASIQGCWNTGNITGHQYVGGICNSVTANVNISSCYNTGTIRGHSVVGGIIGYTTSSASNIVRIANCYTAGEVMSTLSETSGMVAGNFANSNVYSENLYYIADVHGELGAIGTDASNSDAFTAKTSEEMKDAAFVTALNADPSLDYLFKAAEGGYPVTAEAVDNITADTEVQGGSASAVADLSDIFVRPGAVFTIDASAGQAVTGTEVTIPASSLLNLGAAGGLVINTSNGAVEFDAEALAIIAASGDDVIFTVAVIDAENLPEAQRDAAGDAELLVEITIKSGGSDIAFGSDSGIATITLPYTLTKSAAVKVYHIAADGTRTLLMANYSEGFVTFETGHFSVYSIEEENSEYTVSLDSANVNKNVGEEIGLSIEIAGTDYAPVQMDVTYDADLVGYTGSTLDGYTVSDKGGVLKVTRVGDTVPAGEVAGLLKFTVKTTMPEGSEDAVFGVLNALVSVRGEPIDPLPAASGDDVAVGVHNLTVTFGAGDNVTMASVKAYVRYSAAGLYTTNAYGAAFTEPSPTANTGYTLSSPVWNDGSENVSFTAIKGLTFTENAAYTATATQDEYTITYHLDGGENHADNPETYAYGDSFTLQDPAKDDYLFGGWFSDSDLSASATGIAATDTGNKEFWAKWIGEYAITVPDKVTIVSGVENGKAQTDTDVVFKVTGAAEPGFEIVGAGYTVGGGEMIPLAADGDGNYTIPGAAVTGQIEIIVIESVIGDMSFIDFGDYNGAPVGFQVLKLEVETAPQGYTYEYDGIPMLYSEKYEAYVCFVPIAGKDESQSDYNARIRSDIECVLGTAERVNYDGDVNQNSRVNTFDAQIVFDLYTKLDSYLNDTGFNGATREMRLAADVNGDGVVDTTDVQIIISIIHS